METPTVALEATTNLKEKPQDQRELSNVTYKQQTQQHHQGHQNNQQKFLKNNKQQQNHHRHLQNQRHQQQLQKEREQQQDGKQQQQHQQKLQHQTRQQQHQQQQQQQQQKLHGQQSKTIFVINLHQSVTVDDLYELFGLKSANYLRNNCHTEMDHFSNVDQPFAPAPVHLCEELLKLHGIDFHDDPLVIEMYKSPLEQLNHYFQPPLQPPLIHWIIHSYRNATNPKQKDIRYLQIEYQKV